MGQWLEWRMGGVSWRVFLTTLSLAASLELSSYFHHPPPLQPCKICLHGSKGGLVPLQGQGSWKF